MALVDKPKKNSLTNKTTNSCMIKVNGLIGFVRHEKRSDNMLVKTLTDSATLTGLAAGVGWAAKNVRTDDF